MGLFDTMSKVSPVSVPVPDPPPPQTAVEVSWQEPDEVPQAWPATQIDPPDPPVAAPAVAAPVAPAKTKGVLDGLRARGAGEQAAADTIPPPPEAPGSYISRLEALEARMGQLLRLTAEQGERIADLEAFRARIVGQ